MGLPSKVQPHYPSLTSTTTHSPQERKKGSPGLTQTIQVTPSWAYSLLQHQSSMATSLYSINCLSLSFTVAELASPEPTHHPYISQRPLPSPAPQSQQEWVSGGVEQRSLHPSVSSLAQSDPVEGRGRAVAFGLRAERQYERRGAGVGEGVSDMQEHAH